MPFKEGMKEYYRDVNIQGLSKTQIQTNGIISEPIVFDCLTLWYEENRAIYNTNSEENEIKWDFIWDSKFVDYSIRKLQYVNNGHVEAPILIEIEGPVLNPKIELYVEGELYQTVTLTVNITE